MPKRSANFEMLFPLIFLVVFSLAIPNGYSSTIPSIQTPKASEDERQIERDRDKAILEAIGSFDPSVLKPEGVAVEKLPFEDMNFVSKEVVRLRQERKTQFKYLTWTHIKQMITEDTVVARMKFLDERDKNLQTVVERAAGVYVPAQVARERIGLAKWRIAKAIRNFFPEAGIDLNFKKGPLTGVDYLSKEWKMRFRQPIFRGGVLWNTLKMESTNLEVAKREYDKTISNLVAEVSEAYFEFERSRNIYRDQSSLFELAKKQKEISDKKFEQNLTSEIEKLNVDSLYSQTQYDLQTALQELEISKLELQKYLNLEVNDPVDVSSLYDLNSFNIESFKSTAKKMRVSLSAQVPQQTQDDLGQFIELAYNSRPDLQVEAAKLKASQYAYLVTMGKRLPQVDLILEFGKLAESFYEVTDHPKYNKEFRFGAEVSWPVMGNTGKYTFDHDKRAPAVSEYLQGAHTEVQSNTFSFSFLDDMAQFTSLKEARINSLEQVVEIEKTEREVIRDVKEAYFNFNKALIQVESAFKRMSYRKRLAEVSKHRLEENEIQTSEYLQAEISYVEELGLVYKALSEYFLAKAKLNRAIGIRDYLPIETV